MIPCADPADRRRRHRAAIEAAVGRVLDSGWYVLGPEVERFEGAFAAWLGSAHGVGVSSGTAAISLALRALGVGAGDEVITVSHTALATVAAVERAGATPVLVDVCARRWVMRPEAVEAALTPATRAVVAVHLYGNPVEADALRALCDARGLKLVEDCAQAHGATLGGRRVGTFGHAAAFSFYPTKNLGALGDAGLVATDDPDLAEALRRLRAYGWDADRVARAPGENARLDPLQAAILGVRLAHLDADVAARRHLAARYDAALADLPLGRPAQADRADPAYHLYVVTSPRRDALRHHLAEHGVQAGVHYDRGAHQQPGYQAVVHHGPLPVTERLVDQVLSLPLFPELSEADQDTVIAATRAWFGRAP